MDKIEEKINCLNFELKILSGIINKGQLERWVPGFCNPYTENEHQKRYDFVSKHVKNLDVLDIACGVGMGSLIMAKNGAKSITGCDIDQDTIYYASAKNKNEKIEFFIENAEDIKLEKKFDLIVSFETIEHLNNPENFLNCVKKLIKDNGYIFISTPISRRKTNKNPYNNYHKIEWSFIDFQDLIKKYFDIDEIYIQFYEKNNIFKKIIKKLLHLKKNNKYNMEPVLYDNSLKMKNKLNINGGYQIIKCKQKK